MRHDLDVDELVPAQPAGGQRSLIPPALDHEERDIGPASPQLVRDPDERPGALLQRRVDERDEPGLVVLDPDPVPVDRVGQGVAIEPDAIAVMPAGELRGDDAGIDVGQRRGLAIAEVMDREDDGNLSAPGQVDHPGRDGVAAVGEHDVGLEDLQVLAEELQHGADLLGPLASVAGGIQPHDRDRHIAAAGIQHLGAIGPARGRPDLVGLAQLGDDPLEARLVGQIELWGAEGVACRSRTA